MERATDKFSSRVGVKLGQVRPQSGLSANHNAGNVDPQELPERFSLS